VHLPWLPAERLLRTGNPGQAAPPDTPFALVEKQKGAMRLVAVSLQAHLLGLRPGLPLADARARVPGLPAFDHDPAADGILLDQLANACLRYTPRVMAVPPQGLILDISGCHHLFDSNLSHAERLMSDDLCSRLHGAGLTARLAFSVSSDAALALAVYGLEEGQVARLPVTALACDPGVHHALRRAGLSHIGDLVNRPRTMLAARFGEAVTHRLARLLGECDSPIIARRALPKIRCEVRFAEPIAHVDSVRMILGELLADAMRQLAERGQGARAVLALLFRCDGAVARLAIETAAPSRDAALILRLFDERIDALADPLDPGFGYDSIALEIAVAEPLLAAQCTIDNGEAQAHEALAALLARLSTRLGPDRVTRWRFVDTHVPEDVVAHAPAISASPASNMTAAVSGRPLLLLNPPQPVEAIAEVPDGPPYRFRWKGTQHRVARHEGPERIAMPWWEGRHREARLTRDYYRVEDEEGRRFWLFRHGLYEEKSDPRWYMHGLFA
jgi:protein ImuB